MCNFDNSVEFFCPIAEGKCSKSVSIKWVTPSQKIVFEDKFLGTCKVKFCQLCLKNFAEAWIKFVLKEKKIQETTFERKWFSWKRWYGDVNAVLKIVPRNFAPIVWIVFVERLEFISKKISIKRYFLIQNIPLDT